MIVASLRVQMPWIMRLEHTHHSVDFLPAAPQLISHTHAKKRGQIAKGVQRTNPLLQQKVLLFLIALFGLPVIDRPPEGQLSLHIHSKISRRQKSRPRRTASVVPVMVQTILLARPIYTQPRIQVHGRIPRQWKNHSVVRPS